MEMNILERQDAQLRPTSSFIDLAIGHPSDELLPLPSIRQMAAKRLAEAEPSLLQYGMEQGSKYFREVLANFLVAEQEIEVDPEMLFITAGASQALDLICTFLTRPGDTVIVEEPTYFLSFRIFASHGLKVRSVATDENGLVVEDLEAILKEIKPAFLYTIPTYQNPSGVTMSEARRKRLVELSCEHDLLVVADEVYHLLNYGPLPPKPLSSYVSEGTIISVNSFSKILAPGLRLGWIQAAPKLLEPFITSGLLNSGGGLNPFVSTIVAEVLSSGFQREHLNRLQGIYTERIQAVATALRTYLSRDAVFSEPDGGYFFWIRLPEIDTIRLLAVANEHQTNFQPGANFSIHRSCSDFLRLSFAFYETRSLIMGVERLGYAVEQVRDVR